MTDQDYRSLGRKMTEHCVYAIGDPQSLEFALVQDKRRKCAELKARRSRRSVGDQGKIALKRLPAGQRPTIHAVARQLSLSSRTLQRRLAESGVTFQQLLDEARRELAHHYLRQSSVELNETAYLLGYGDPNSFFRAFHDWEGTSPGQWRLNHRSQSVR